VRSNATIRLRYLLRPREVVGKPHLQVLSVYRDHGVVPKDSRSDNYNRTPLDLTRYQEVRVGDLVVNKMKAWQGSLALSGHHGLVSPDYLVCEVTGPVDQRFLHYLLRSKPHVAEIRKNSKGIRPAQWRIYWEDLANIGVLVPPPDEQQRIADFLDIETRRIGAMQRARSKQVELLTDRLERVNADVIEQALAAFGEVALRRVQVGIEQGWSPQCEDTEAEPDEWAVLKTSSVSTGHFDPLQHKRLPSGMSPVPRFQVRDGDLLITRGSGSPRHVGMAAVARTDGRLLMISDLLYRVRLAAGWAPTFVAAALRAAPIRERVALLLRGQSGQTIKLRAEDVKEIPIPAAPAGEQVSLGRSLADAEEETLRACGGLERGLQLLAERRQELITAAVTGEIDVTTAGRAAEWAATGR
jgi:type I restriction enzyme, S subunit